MEFYWSRSISLGNITKVFVTGVRTHDDMWEVLLGIRHHGCPVSDTSAHNPDVVLQNLSKGQSPDGGAKRLFSLRGPVDSIETFAEEFREHEGVTRFERISAQNDGVAYFTSELEYDSDNPSVLELMYRNGCYQHTTVNVSEGVETWKLYTEDRGNVHDLIADVESRDNDVTLYRSKDLGEIDGARSLDFESLATRLTPRQQTVFETALSLGYYEDRTDVTTEEIGEELDLHQSTVWEHLNKAENALLSEIGRELFGSGPAE